MGQALAVFTNPGLQLAEPRTAVPVGPLWIHQPKLNGFRVLGGKFQGRTFLKTRNSWDVLASFPEVGEALAALEGDDVVLDGELVMFDTDGRSAHQDVRKRAGRVRTIDVTYAARTRPATFVAFDVLGLADWDTRQLSWTKRDELLRNVVGRTPTLYAIDSFDDGDALLQAMRDRAWEGVVSKLRGSAYTSGRSGAWVKVLCDAERATSDWEAAT